MNELFSVIILCYNNSEYLKGSLDAVLIQKYPNIELIVADDCSRSFEVEHFEKYCLDNKKYNIKRVLIYSNPENLGTVKNANTAMAKAQGKYFKIIGGDDQLADNMTLIHAAKALEKCRDGMITSNVIKCDREMNVIGQYNDRLKNHLKDMSPQECFARLCIHNEIIDGGVFMRRDFFEKYGCFDEKYRLLEDWPMWLKATHAGCKIEYADFAAMKYRTAGGIGTSVNPIYLADKKTVLETEIIPRRKELGLVNYALARLSFLIHNSVMFRKLYAFLLKRKH